MQIFLHAGESLLRENNQLVDALLLGTKRIGHGYNLIQHPELIEMVKERDVCLECCPISNKVLGQVLDTRCHPVRTLMQMGVAVSISSDDPGFWGYQGCTLDYVYAFLSWDLNLAELK
jgi:adenosine deaminase CECR1